MEAYSDASSLSLVYSKESALKRENIPVPNFPSGEFLVIKAEFDYQVAIFKYSSNAVAGCRSTSSAQHRALPFPIKAHKKVAHFTKEPVLRLGYQFLWGVNQAYQVCEGKVNLGEFEVPDATNVEVQRTTVLVHGLKMQYGEKYRIMTPSGRNSTQFCQFSGGGDVEIVYNAVSSAALLVGQEEKDTAQQHTPPKSGEVRSGIVENKVTSQQTGEQVTRQLMANMVLLGGTTLEEIVKCKQPVEVEMFSHLVIYGCQMSPVYLLKLLKLCMEDR